MKYVSVQSLLTALSGLPANVKTMSYRVDSELQPIPIVSAHGTAPDGSATETVVRYIDLTVPSANVP